MTSGSKQSRTGLRAQQKARTRQAIQEHALRLFLAKGYEATTVAEIASAAGVSHMTFFRYFAGKEAVVETDDYDPMLADLIRQRPAEESPLTAVHQAVLQGLSAIYTTDRDAILARTRLILGTPALRARQWRNLDATQALFAEAMAARLDTAITFEIQVLAAAAVAALTTAISEWAANNGRDDLATLVDNAFHALQG
ncbi:MAG: acyl-CoA-like ligand-binding transcription factor [Pseudonocardiales bacterium]